MTASALETWRRIVMVRPLKAVNMLDGQMKAMLERMAAGQGRQAG